jgi:hypothetical protein
VARAKRAKRKPRRIRYSFFNKLANHSDETWVRTSCGSPHHIDAERITALI